MMFIRKFKDLEALDAGKPRGDTVFEIDFAIATFRYYAGYSDKIHGKTIPAGSLFRITP